MSIERYRSLSLCGLWFVLACRSQAAGPVRADASVGGGTSGGNVPMGGSGGVSVSVVGMGAAPMVGGGGTGGASGGASSTFAPVLALGPFAACLVSADQALRCAGQCGPTAHGGSRDKPPPGLHVRTVAVGREFACAVLAAPGSAGAVQCWGAGPAAEPPLLTDSAELVAGDRHACSRDQAGTVTCWGDASQAPPTGVVAKGLAASGAMTCAITNGDSVQCWGPHAVVPPADLKAARLALSSQLADPLHGPRFACAVTPSGSVRCFGDDVGGVLQPPNGLLAKQVALGRSHACAIGQDDAVICWGAIF